MRNKNKTSQNNMNDSMMSTGSLAIEEDEYANLVKDLDTEDIH